jgi:hypothetical protein
LVATLAAAFRITFLDPFIVLGLAFHKILTRDGELAWTIRYCTHCATASGSCWQEMRERPQPPECGRYTDVIA